MAVVLREVYKQYIYYAEEMRDKRLDDYPLMGSPIKIVAVVGLYYYFVRFLGPKLMEDRKPFVLKKILMAYNIMQVFLNGCLVILGIQHMIDINYSFRCQLCIYDTTPQGMLQARMSYFYYALKVLDLLDTVFFVLRKKYNQATFLHLYHHIIMCLAVYACVQYAPGGHASMLGIVNAFVHCVMYYYYFLTSVRRSNQENSLWWKKHITHLQMAQFTFLIIHFGHPLILGNCGYPKFWLFLGLIQNIFMFILFADFYVRSYIKKKDKK